MKNRIELFFKDVSFYRAERQIRPGKVENGLIFSPEALPEPREPAKIQETVYVSLTTGEIKRFNFRAESRIVPGEKISPQEAMYLVEQFSQDQYRNIDRQLAEIKKAIKLY